MGEEEEKKVEEVVPPAEEVEEVIPPAKKTPVKVVPPKKCDHKGKLEAITARESEIDMSLAMTMRHDFFRCTSCGAIIVKDKK